MKKYCPECQLPMFCYPIIHNGKPEKIYRCLSAHGKVFSGFPKGHGRIRPGTKARLGGARGYFNVVFRSRLTNDH